MSDFSSISLFTGAGGMDVGFSTAGFKAVWANDIDKDACATYQLNHQSPIDCGNIDDYFEKIKAIGSVDCIFGGPPCQGFSVAGKMDANDPRSQLIWSFMHAVELTHPKCFVMENVKALATLSKFEAVRKRLFITAQNLGYTTKLLILNSKYFGVPQNRERMFLIGFKDEDCANRIEDAINKYIAISPTVGEVIRPLGKAGTGHNIRICNARITNASNPVLRKSPYAGMLFNGQGRPINPDGYASTIAASMGGNRTPIIDESHLYEHEDSYIEEYHAYLMVGGLPKPMMDVPKRLRRLTIDEAILIQTFPADYDFYGKQSSVWRQIGNAVPCKLAEAVARGVRDVLTGPKNYNKKIQAEFDFN